MNFFPLFQVEVDPPDRPSAAPPRRHKTAHELSESEEEQEDMEDPRDPDFMPGDSDDDPDSDFPDHWDVDGTPTRMPTGMPTGMPVRRIGISLMPKRPQLQSKRRTGTYYDSRCT